MFFTLDLHSLGFLDEALLSAVGGHLVYLLSVEHIYWLFKFEKQGKFCRSTDHASEIDELKAKRCSWPAQPRHFDETSFFCEAFGR